MICAQDLLAWWDAPTYRCIYIYIYIYTVGGGIEYGIGDLDKKTGIEEEN
jgi:hypothetical protein